MKENERKRKEEKKTSENEVARENESWESMYRTWKIKWRECECGLNLRRVWFMAVGFDVVLESEKMVETEGIWEMGVFGYGVYGNGGNRI